MSSNRPPKTSTPPAGSKPPLATSSHPPRVSKPPNVFEPGKLPDLPPSKPPVVPKPPTSKPPTSKQAPSLPPIQSEAAKAATPSMAPAVGGVARSNIFDAPSEPGLNASELTAAAASDAPSAAPIAGAATAAAPSVLTELTRSFAALHASEEPTTPSADIDLLLAARKATAVEAPTEQSTTADQAAPAAPAPEVSEHAPDAPAELPVAATPAASSAQAVEQAPQVSPPRGQTLPTPAQPSAPAAVMDPRAVVAPAPALQASYTASQPSGFAPSAAVGFDANTAQPSTSTKPKVIAPTLVIYGAAFWAYLVLGELVVRLDFSERLAFAALLGIFIRHCYSATERATYKGAFQRFIPGVLAALLWLVTLFMSATVLGTSSRSSVAAVTLLLWFFAIAVYSIGRILSDGPPPTEPKLTWRSGKRWWKVSAWVVSVGFTAVALLSAFDAA